ncbi:MAG TPA: nitronate monooxygenase, partial [Gemmatimonadaceae bacterium]|nr:nitronate monooxygenase [Gemmatimonadaceae bacterium]
PRFLAIVSATSLASTLVRKASGRVDGLVIEGPTAGGHNAPPRGTLTLDATGQPVYGERDAVDLTKIRELGVPFWLAGGSGRPGALDEALAAGAAGIQVGTLFAFSEESGLAPEVRAEALAAIREERATVFTDPDASPTGYPFKLLQTSEVDAGAARVRNCDLGYLRTAFRRPDGRIDYRCPAEPVEQYVAKGGDAADTVGRRCLCNGLLANVGHAQVRDDGTGEPTLLTTGDAIDAVRTLLGGRESYRADDVIDWLAPGTPIAAD